MRTRDTGNSSKACWRCDWVRAPKEHGGTRAALEMTMNLRCDNCGGTYADDSELACVYPDIPDLLVRIEPGGTVPHGECPNCGCLVYDEPEPEPEMHRCLVCGDPWSAGTASTMTGRHWPTQMGGVAAALWAAPALYHTRHGRRRELHEPGRSAQSIAGCDHPAEGHDCEAGAALLGRGGTGGCAGAAVVEEAGGAEVRDGCR